MLNHLHDATWAGELLMEGVSDVGHSACGTSIQHLLNVSLGVGDDFTRDLVDALTRQLEEVLDPLDMWGWETWEELVRATNSNAKARCEDEGDRAEMLLRADELPKEMEQEMEHDMDWEREE